MIDMEIFFKTKEFVECLDDLEDLIKLEKLCSTMSNQARMAAAAELVLRVIETTNKPIDEVLGDLNNTVKEVYQDESNN